MQFKVPQFIDIEDKLFGPFTFYQFAYLVGGAGIIFILYKLLPFFIAIILIIPVAILTALLVFYKINNKPFIYYLQAALVYAFGSKLYVWKQRLVKHQDQKEEEDIPQRTSMVPVSSGNTLKDLSWRLEVHDDKKE
jgi:hypothetical protein